MDALFLISFIPLKGGVGPRYPIVNIKLFLLKLLILGSISSFLVPKLRIFKTQYSKGSKEEAYSNKKPFFNPENPIIALI
jgi:hypothetical protein